MDIQEFRQKYPQYDDMGDKELGDTLYQKHYSDMDRAEFDANFMGHGSMTAAPPKWKRNVSDLAHNTLPMLGGGVGGVVGTAADPVLGPGGTIAGGGLGFAAGEQAADVLDEWLGVVPPRGWKDSAINAGENLYEGAKAEAFGLGLAGAGQRVVKGAQALARTKPGNAVVQGTKNIVSELVPHTSERAAQEEIGRLVAQFQRTGDEAYIEEARQIAQKVPGFRATHGMAANNRDLISLERGTLNASASKPGLEGAQGQVEDLIQGNVAASRQALQGMKTGSADDLAAELARQKAAMEAERQTLSQVNPQATGQKVLSSIDEAHQPVKKTMQRLNEAVPDYPVNVNNTQKVLKELRAQKDLSKNQHAAVAKVGNDIAEQFQKTGQTTRTMIGVQRTVNDAINQASAKGDDSTVAVLMQVKTALKGDIDEVAAMARTGRLKTYEGKPVFPDALAAELEENTLRQMDLLSKEKPDIDGMVDTLLAKKHPAMRVAGETDEAFNKRIVESYEKVTGQEAPIIADKGAKKAIADLERRNATIHKILGEVEPGQDVAALLNARNRYAETEHFGRFGNESVKGAKAARNLENVAGKFSTETGADDLIKAIGRDEAQNAMRPYYQEQVSSLLNSNPSDARMMQWLRSNNKVLRKLGLQDELKQIVKNQQGYRELEKIAGTDIESLFSQIVSGQGKGQRQALNKMLRRIKGNPKAQQGLKASFVDYLEGKMFRELGAGREGFGQVEKSLDQLQPALQKVFSTQEIETLGYIRKAIQRTQGFTSTSALGGSQTQELLKAAERLTGETSGAKRVADLMVAALSYPVGSSFGGMLGGMSTVTAVGTLREAGRRHGQEAVRRYFVRATFDPEYAKTLMYMVKQPAMNKAIINRLKGQMGRLVSRQAVATFSGQGTTPQAQPQ